MNSAFISLVVIILLAWVISGCATRYQPPGGGLYVAVKHMEQQRKKP